jgi:AsmA protein
MKPRELPWKWLLLGLAGVLLLGIALLPRLIGDQAKLGEEVASQLSAWTGGEVKLTGPMEIRYFPDISVRTGLRVEGGTRLPLVQSIDVKDAKISLDPADLLRGRITVDALNLIHPTITLVNSDAGTTPPAGEPQAMIAGLFGGAPVSVVHVQGGKIIIPTLAGEEEIKAIAGHFDGSAGAGAVSGFGSFMWRGVVVRFALDSGALSPAANGPSLPVTLTIASEPIKAKISGTASFTGGLGLDGDMQTRIADLRTFLTWVGLPMAEGQSLKGLTASGVFHLRGPTLTFDDGAFSLDGNSAVGLLAVTGWPRPRVEGTLAFDRLVLDPYLTDGQASAAVGILPSSGQSTAFDWRLPQYFDADLRISAGKIAAGALKLGRGGLTLTAKQGVLVGEVGELELCGGSGTGRVGLDLSQPAKRLTLVASLSDIIAESCLQQLALPIPLKGKAVIKTELATEGRDLSELMAGLSGSLKIAGRDGAVPVDLDRLMGATIALEGDSWSGNGGTTFETLDADCRLGGGHIWCETFSMQTPRGLVSGSGDIDLPRQALDWDLVVADRADTATTSQLTAQNAPKVSIRGSLSQPMIRRADRPTLGEGSPQTGPLTPSISPR